MSEKTFTLDSTPIKSTIPALNIEQISYECAQAGFFFDLRRTLACRDTLAGKWECRLQPFVEFDGDWPYGTGKTAREAYEQARRKIPKAFH